MQRYKQIQITSTKCQYHAAASKPTWRVGEKRNVEQNRKVQTRINVVPINTWSPWKPVAIKKVLP